VLMQFDRDSTLGTSPVAKSEPKSKSSKNKENGAVAGVFSDRARSIWKDGN
jgi:hypothetical protein